MIKIDRFRIKNGASISDLTCRLNEGGRWIHPKSSKYTFRSYGRKNYELTFDVAFPDDLSIWNDFDFVLVRDYNFGQPYLPFYNRLYGSDIDYPYLDDVVSKYNKFMESLEILEKIE